VKFTRAMIVLGILLYLFLWVLALNGVQSLVAPLIIPLVLALLVAGGVALNRFMGITPSSPQFNNPHDHDDDDEKDAA
jgi:hypothetical protein